MPPKKQKSESKWTVYKMKEFEEPLFESLPGTLMLYTSDMTGNCGPDSIAVLAQEEPTPKLFAEMRNIARSSEMHDIENEYYGDDDDNQEKFWLDKEDIVCVCIKKYNLFPIIYNSFWRPNKKEPAKKRTAAQNAKLKKNPDQPCLICPQFVIGENLYARPKPNVKYVIIQMVKEQHYQAMGVMSDDGKLQTQFSQSELSEELLSMLESLCFANAEDFQSEIEINKEIAQLQQIAKDLNPDVFQEFKNENFASYYNALDNRRTYKDSLEEAKIYGDFKFISASTKDKEKLAAACFASLVAKQTGYARPPMFAAPQAAEYVAPREYKAPPAPKKRIGTPQHYVDLTEEEESHGSKSGIRHKKRDA